MSGLPEPFAPAGIGYSFLDWFGAYNMANAALSGIYRSARTGEGCHIDASQVEAGIYLTGTSILDHSANGRRWSRFGNRSPYKLAAPHGIYRVAGDDRWIAISCFGDEEWNALATALSREDWLKDQRFATLDDRLRNQEDLDVVVNDQTARYEGFELMQTLQEAGIPAGMCQTAADRCDRDPQLSHNNWMVSLPHTDIGSWPVKEVPFRMEDTPPTIGGPLQRQGPNYGEDSDYVLTELLGLSEEAVHSLRNSGVVGA
jgi:crotonobetainyl-CoA:carnitine CoA-transferase CaiB-like acyl-CoA transferase